MCFNSLPGLAQVVFGQHNVMLLDGSGKVFSIGRHDYGVLGLGEDVTAEVHVPTKVNGELSNKVSILLENNFSDKFSS
jgi:alpha-tubulin suppressor-like RCC1 family protein